MEEYEYLAHHGIKGMKWGVRRFQNEDGSLTDKGVKRYSTKAARLYYKAERHKIRQSHAHDFESYKRAGRREQKARSKMDRVSAALSKSDIDRARQHVASSRRTKFAAASVASAAATGAGIAFMSATPVGAISMAAIGAYATGKAIGRTAYYHREKRMYDKNGKADK